MDLMWILSLYYDVVFWKHTGIIHDVFSLTFRLWIFYVHLWYVNELHYISSSGAPDLRLQSLADVPQLDALDETWVEALHSSSLLIGKTNWCIWWTLICPWYVHLVVSTVLFSSCYSFPVLLLFFPHVFLNTCFSPLLFSLLTKQ